MKKHTPLIRFLSNNLVFFSKANNISFASEFYRNKTLENLYPRTQVVRIGNEILVNRTSHHSTNHTDNVTKIGIGVSEYINDPWKQKTELFEAVAANVYNHIDDTKFDNGDGRRLVYINVPKEDESSNQTETSSLPSNISETDTATRKKDDKVKDKSPYEFVTEQIPAGTLVVLDSDPVKNLESEITEPVLKPKLPIGTSIRARKSQHTYRPHYGKSINVVNPKWRVSTSTAYVKAFPNTLLLPSTTSHYQNSSISGSVTTIVPETVGMMRMMKNTEHEKTRKYDDTKNSSQLFVVQFLPQKLISFFEQAERYARLAFLPFISPADSSKSATERSRRIRTFTTNRWGSNPSKDTANERRDLNVDETRNVAPVVIAPPAKTTVFPYAFQQSQNQLWQHVLYEDSERKYIPLTPNEPKITFEEEQIIRSTQQVPNDPK